MFTTIWAFLNSPVGSALALSAIGWLFKKGIDSKARRQQILAYADRAFHTVEMLNLPGTDKYNRYIESIINALHAANQPELEADEMEMLKRLAREKALLAKPKSPPPLPPP